MGTEPITACAPEYSGYAVNEPQAKLRLNASIYRGQLILHKTHRIILLCCDILPAGYIILSVASNIPADTDETLCERHRLFTVQNNVAPYLFMSQQANALHGSTLGKNGTEVATLLSIKSVQLSNKKIFH